MGYGIIEIPIKDKFKEPLDLKGFTETQITNALLHMYDESKARIEEMFSELTDKQHLEIAFKRNGSVKIGIVANGEHMVVMAWEALAWVEIPANGDLEEIINTAIVNRTYKT